MVAAVFTTFRPSPGVVTNILAVASQVDKVIVVDNGSPEAALEPFRSLCIPHFTLLRNETNRGIAAALNQGMMRAAELGCEYALLLDQDSTATEGMVSTLLTEFHLWSTRTKVGLISTHNIARDSGQGHSALHDESGLPVVAMTSGSLVPLEVLKSIGMMEENLFIEFVDHAFCLRLREHGYSIIGSLTATLRHDVGFPRRHSFLGFFHCTCVHHSAQRRYYFARNLTVLARRYRTKESAWFQSEVLSFARSVLKIFLFEDLRLQKLVWTVRGILDALRGRMGYTVQL